jgi:hypothetical protein
MNSPINNAERSSADDMHLAQARQLR